MESPVYCLVWPLARPLGRVPTYPSVRCSSLGRQARTVLIFYVG